MIAVTLAVILLVLVCVPLVGAALLWKSFDSGRNPITMQLDGDTLTCDYSPVFYFDGGFSLTEREKADIIAGCVAGFKRWEGVYQLSGCEFTVVVNVYPALTGEIRASSVRVLPYNFLETMVPGCLLWRPDSTHLTMFLRSDTPLYRDYGRTAMHEFGHVLGLFDAYGYGSHRYTILGLDVSGLAERLLPEAPPDRASWNSVMRGGGGEVTSTEIEMLLWAWKNNRLQLYTESALTRLGAQVSPAFSD